MSSIQYYDTHMTFEKYCHEAIKKLGRLYKEVHNWLDEFAHSVG